MATCSCALTDICTALAPGTDKQLTPSRTQPTVRVVDSHRPRWLSGAYSGEILLVVLAFVALIHVRRNPVLCADRSLASDAVRHRTPVHDQMPAPDEADLY